MDPSLSVQIICLALLLLASGFFSASETALMALSKLDVRYMIEQNIKGADKLDKLLEDPNKLLGSILVGNNLVNIMASSLATMIAIGLSGGSSSGIGVGIATGVMTLLVLIFGEITPKSLSTQNAQKIALLVVSPISIIVKIFSPVVTILMFITNTLIKLLGGNPDASKPFITADELKTILNVSHEEGVIETEEKEMINNVFDFGQSCAKDIMIPRTDMIAIDIDSTYNDIIELYKKEQFSRMPVYKDSLDHIIGILHIKDLILNNIDKMQFKTSDYLRDAYFVHEFKNNDELFKEMRSQKIGVAIVLDEYGGTSGLVSMEDLIEEIVGDIDDEYDQVVEDVIKIKDGEYVVDGSSRIPDINEELNLRITSEDFDSIGGFVIGLFDRFPDSGEEITFNELTFKIEETVNNRINRLRITINEAR
ncbi:MAG: hemolysin family protein [Cellulosilyticum sp.]|nr:HlyC/CorC family transporter [Cellulosilyticum sp.]MEE1071795.1 hemolysin family protein [Cellulosilyticum sp.]